MHADAAPDAVTVRDYRSGDEPAVLELLAASMGWIPDDQHREYFRWKHEHNAFGRSAAWVAVDGDRIVGFRTFMRWEFLHDGVVRRAVRAVDTATHPDYQGRGIFSTLTQHGLRAMEREGVDFVFNTPNSKSLPGYLKMGWVELGRADARIRIAPSPRSLLRVARARTPAERWSIPTTAGVAAAEALTSDRLEPLTSHAPSPSRAMTTRRSVEYLRWRYCGYAPLAYRCVLCSDDPAEGVIVFRLRRRGSAVEAVVNDVLVPPRKLKELPRMWRELSRSSGADYVLQLAGKARHGFLPLPRQGPTVTFRGLRFTEPPPLRDWHQTMGDIELF